VPRLYLFANESGNFDFSRGRGASRYFILTTVALVDTEVGDALLALRRELAWDRVGLDTEFHATTDAQAVRDRVFTLLTQHTFRVHATIVDKPRVPLALRATDLALYGHAWTLHLARVLPEVAGARDELLVVGASIGTRRRRAAFHDAITRAAGAAGFGAECRVASWDARATRACNSRITARGPCSAGGRAAIHARARLSPIALWASTCRTRPTRRASTESTEHGLKMRRD